MNLKEHRVTRGLRRIAGRLGRRGQDWRDALPERKMESPDVKRSRLLIVGHSHIECLRIAAAGRDDLDHVTFLNLRHFPDDDDDAADKLRTEIEKFAPEAICLCLAGNQHNTIGLIENPIPFALGDHDAGSVPVGPSDRMFIPNAMMRDHLESGMPMALAARIFASVPDSRRLYLNPPPPIPDLDHIRQYPSVFKDKLHLGFAPNELRLALYRIQADLLRALAQREGAAFIEVDPRLVDEKGFLGKAYFNRDPTHGNVAYGRVMLSRILQAAGSAS